MKPLSKKQKAVLGQMANRAYKALVTCGCPLDDYATWRREQQLEATGIDSMSKMEQRHYIPLLNHYNKLLGKDPAKNNTWSPKDNMMHRLTDAMEKQEIDKQFVRDVVVDQFNGFDGYGPDEILEAIKIKLDADSIEKLSFTVISRGRERTRKLNSKHGLDPKAITEPHAHQSTVPPGGLGAHFNTINAKK